jgi:probable phosphoglycerate mutase
VSDSEEVPTVETRLLLVRHGESNVTVQRVLGGELSDSGLSDLGIRQAEALRDRLAREGSQVDAIVSSSLPRALETAEIVSPSLDPSAIRVETELVERRPGEADGMTFDAYLAKYGNDIWSDPYQELAPGGESAAGFHDRVVVALTDLLLSYRGQTAVVFCHGGVIDVAFREFLDTARHRGFELWTLNTSITEFLQIDTGEGLRWRLVRYNDSAHLAGLPRKTEVS